MSREEREEYMKTIQTNLTDILFTRFIILLTDLDPEATDSILQAFGHIFNKKATSFWYEMPEEATINTISIMREIIDLLDGWVITSYAKQDNGTLAWNVSSII